VHATGIERRGDVAQGGRPGFLDLAHNGQHIGRVLIGGGAVCHAPELRRFLDLRAARDEIEGMLATQMVATHIAAMTALRGVMVSEMLPQHDSYGNLAVKLLRTFAAQVEALHRYRGKGEQKVIVEHVHVHPGGQAIVGTVTPVGGGGVEKSEEQAHASRGISYEPGIPMRSPDPEREVVPVAGGARKAPV
jgi:hypothetical protein